MKEKGVYNNSKKLMAEEKKKKSKSDKKKKGEEEKQEFKNLGKEEIAMMNRYGQGPYSEPIKKKEEEVKAHQQKVSKLCGIKESDTGLSLPSQWFLDVRS